MAAPPLSKNIYIGTSSRGHQAFDGQLLATNTLLALLNNHPHRNSQIQVETSISADGPITALPKAELDPQREQTVQRATPKAGKRNLSLRSLLA
jgi:hypothetical protein